MLLRYAAAIMIAICHYSIFSFAIIDATTPLFRLLLAFADFRFFRHFSLLPLIFSFAVLRHFRHCFFMPFAD